MLAKALKSIPSAAGSDLGSQHCVDILLGGHDHMYYVSKGCKSWDGYDIGQPVLGSESDDGVLLVKSGTDFRDLSVMELQLRSDGDSAIRRWMVQAVEGTLRIQAPSSTLTCSTNAGRRLAPSPSEPGSPQLKEILDKLLSSVSETLKVPLCRTQTVLDVTSPKIRTEEVSISLL